VKQNEQHLDEGSRWVLYHGTSTARLKHILVEDRLRRATIGDQKIPLTKRSVAEYFGCNAVFGDKHDHPEEESTGVVLVLDGEELLALNYDLAEFRDPFWGDGECDWENEIECWDDIEPLEEVLIRVEAIPPQRYQDFIERGPASFKPTTPPIAGFELTVMADTIGKLVEDEIRPADADIVVSALARLRSALELGRAKSSRVLAADRRAPANCHQ
jgi:hypothetical protein